MTAKKKAAKKPTQPLSDEVVIALSIKTPDGEMTEEEIVIKHASGCMMPAARNDGAGLVKVMRDGLIQKYGKNFVE